MDRRIRVLHVARPFGSWAVTGLFNWDAARKQLRIKVALVANYPTTLSVYPAGRSFKEARATGATVEAVAEGEIVRAKLTSAKSGDVEVTLQFE